MLTLLRKLPAFGKHSALIRCRGGAYEETSKFSSDHTQMS